MADKMMRVAARSSNGRAKSLNVDDSGRLKTSLGGVEEVVIFDRLEIRDTNVYSEIVDLSLFKEVRWKVFSILDQDVTLYFSTERRYKTNSFHIPLIWNGTEWVADAYREFKVINREVNKIYDITSKLEWLKWGKRIRVNAKCNKAPVSGEITIIVEGVLN